MNKIKLSVPPFFFIPILAASKTKVKFNIHYSILNILLQMFKETDLYITSNLFKAGGT